MHYLAKEAETSAKVYNKDSFFGKAGEDLSKLVWASLPVVAVVGVWGGFAAMDSNHQLKVVDAKPTISLLPGVLESNGLKIDTQDTIDNRTIGGEPTVGFKVTKSDLRFTLKDGKLGAFDGTGLNLKGSVRISTKKGSLDFRNLMVSKNKGVNDALQVTSGLGSDAFVAFDLAHARTLFDYKNMSLYVNDMDLLVSAATAQRLGKPELEGVLMGTMSIQMISETSDGRTLEEPPAPPPAAYEGPIDVAISAMGSLTIAGRAGTYPNGRNGLTMSTTSCNVGTQNIPWAAPMNVQHPVIAMNLYRMKDGKFEQVGWSWLKHGFFATNSPGCGTCQSPGTGSLLGPGCSDTYGTGNNSAQFYLGGRDEVNPFTGVWTCTNSYFSNYQNDCVDRRNSLPALDGAAHRLEVADADMANAGATYVYEAYYINTNETDKYNQISSRRANITRPGNSFVIQELDSQQTLGPAINRWGDMRATATPRTEGDVIVAVKVTDLGGGMYRYDYALYNHDLDRQVREFSVPVPAGATVQNMEFRDIDNNANNQWTASFSDEKVQFTTGVFGSSTANPLKYSSVFNFRFDTNAAPSSGKVKMGLFKPGSSTELLAGVKAPLFLQPATSFQLVGGFIAEGGLESLASSDDDRMKITPSSEGTRSGTGITGELTAPEGSVSTLAIGVEGSNSHSNTVGARQIIELWNWGTGSWEQLDSRATTQADSLAVISVSANASRFVNTGDRRVRFRLTHKSNAGSSTKRWSMFIDQVGVQIS